MAAYGLHSWSRPQQDPDPRAGAIRLANELFSHKVWVLWKGILLHWGLGRAFKNYFLVCCRRVGFLVPSSVVFKATCLGSSSLSCRSYRLVAEHGVQTCRCSGEALGSEFPLMGDCLFSLLWCWNLKFFAALVNSRQWSVSLSDRIR